MSYVVLLKLTYNMFAAVKWTVFRLDTNVKYKNHVFLDLEVGSNFINDVHMWHLSKFFLL